MKNLAQHSVNFNGDSGFITDDLVLNLDAGNVASYPGSGTAWTDLSPEGNNATLLNGASYSTEGGGSISFNGTTQYATIPHDISMNPEIGDFTVCCWVKLNPATLTGDEPIFNKGNYTVLDQYTAALRNAPFNGFYFQERNTTQILNTSPSVSVIPDIETNDFYFYTFVIDQGATNEIKVYFQAVERAVNTPALATIANTNEMRLGRGSGASYGNVKIAHFFMYKGVALTPAQITQNFNATKARYGY